jgi:LmbE family N-acetylglucosaminyl deacetylase
VIVLDDADVERVLAVVAHPDDAEFWAAGTIAHWTDAGAEVTYCVLTDGENGSDDPGIPRQQIPAVRREEQRKAAGLLGDVCFLGLGEGMIDPASWELHECLVRVIRQVRPQRVLTWSPERNWARFRSCHPDHLGCGEATLRAIYPDAGNRLALPALFEDEGLDGWTVSEAWLLNSPRVNRYVDITGAFPRKTAAVAAHHSQVARRADLAGDLRARAARVAAEGGLAEDRLAEAFQVVTTGLHEPGRGPARQPAAGPPGTRVPAR